MIETPTLPATAPLIVGATGGSGTRVIARIVQRCGYEIGTHLNHPLDALEFLPFHERWIDRWLARPGRVPAQMREDLTQVIARHLATADGTVFEPGGRWGWKAPRSIYLLAFFHECWPEMKFVHVLRDGRDMSLSKNQNQLRKHGRRLLSWSERWLAPQPVRSIRLWDRVNRRAADFGDQTLGKNYLPLRFEDLCEHPVDTLARLLEFIGGPGDPATLAREEVRPPATLGRWRREPPSLIARLEAAGGDGLRRFGYLA
jgi:Sulfotransferase family